MLQQTLHHILHSERFEIISAEAIAVNPIFTRRSIEIARQAIVEQFLDRPIEQCDEKCGIRVGLVCAGNIPMVGFADMFHAIRAGAELYLKPSRRDPMMRLFEPLCSLVDSIPENLDILLAMGSDSTMQSIKEQHPTTQLVLRGERHSVAIIDGSESAEDIEKLGDDLFIHAAMGCRSIGHIYLPHQYDISQLRFTSRGDELPELWYNNYRYQRAMRTMRSEKFIDGGFFILSQSDGFCPTPQPQSVITYSFYRNPMEIMLHDQQIQCVVAHPKFDHARRVDFGRAQFPSLTDHADGIDVYKIIREKTLPLSRY